MEGVVPRLDDVRVIIASDFEQAVRDRVDDPGYAAAYTADRLFGRASAKTIGQHDGSTDLVIDAWLLSKSNPPQGHDIERLFHHEALHISVDQRAEQISDLRLRHGYEHELQPGLHFGGVTGVMIEEYRTERALCKRRRGHQEGAFGHSLAQRFEHVKASAGFAARPRPRPRPTPASSSSSCSPSPTRSSTPPRRPASHPPR